MARKLLRVSGPMVLAVVVTILLLIPAVAYADIPIASIFYGPVTVDGQIAPTGTNVTAWIDGAAGGPWRVTVFRQAQNPGTVQYRIDIPADDPKTPGKEGGVNGDMIHFSVTVGGTTIPGPSGQWQLQNIPLERGYLPLNVNTPSLSISTAVLPEGKVGDAYSVSLIAAGGKTPYAWSAAGLPSGLSVSGGMITGTPSASGDFSVIVTVTDSASPPSSKSATLALHVYPALAMTTASLSDGVKGKAYSANLTATGGKPSYSWTASGLSAGLSISTSGAITGTPTASTGNVSANVTVTVTDSFTPANHVTMSLSLRIWAQGDANGDGVVNIADVTKVERIILGMDPVTLGADANLDGVINIADVTKIELIILGM